MPVRTEEEIRKRIRELKTRVKDCLENEEIYKAHMFTSEFLGLEWVLKESD